MLSVDVLPKKKEEGGGRRRRMQNGQISLGNAGMAKLISQRLMVC